MNQSYRSPPDLWCRDPGVYSFYDVRALLDMTASLDTPHNLGEGPRQVLELSGQEIHRVAYPESPTGSVIVASRAVMEAFLTPQSYKNAAPTTRSGRSLTDGTNDLCEALNEPIVVLLRYGGAAIFEPFSVPRRSIPKSEPDFNRKSEPTRSLDFASQIEVWLGRGFDLYSAVAAALDND